MKHAKKAALSLPIHLARGTLMAAVDAAMWWHEGKAGRPEAVPASPGCSRKCGYTVMSAYTSIVDRTLTCWKGQSKGTGAELSPPQKKSVSQWLFPVSIINTKHWAHVKMMKQMNRDTRTEHRGVRRTWQYNKRCTGAYCFFCTCLLNATLLSTSTPYQKHELTDLKCCH